MKEKAGEIIKKIRLKNKVSQKTLGNAVGLSQQAIALIESGKRRVDFDTFVKIMDSLEMPLSAIYASNRLEDFNTELGQLILSRNQTRTENELLSAFRELNIPGQAEAIKRVTELKHIPGFANTGDLPFD